MRSKLTRVTRTSAGVTAATSSLSEINREPAR